MKKVFNFSVDIGGAFGSDFQYETHLKSLQLLLMAWKQFAETRHIANSIYLNINDRDNQLPPIDDMPEKQTFNPHV